MITKWPYVDCQGLAGAWTLGTVQTGGFDLIHRASLKGGFGDAVIGTNRHLVGADWEQDEGGASAEWTPVTAAYLNGTPPCSGFSLLNVTAAAARKNGKAAPDTARGVDSAINECMRELIRYASKCTGTDGRYGPEVISFESVQGAGKLGRPLMQALRAMLEDGTGEKYALNHVFMSGSTIGAAQMRHRYFVVFSRVPFGIDPAEPRRVVTYNDAIGDLIGLPLQWEAQPYQPRKGWHPWWVDEQGIRAGNPDVTAHVTYGGENDRSVTRSVYLELLKDWAPGEDRIAVMQRYVDKHGDLPDPVKHWWIHEEGRTKGFSGPRRIRGDVPGYVMTGGAVSEFFHWAEDRYLSVRECARLMGYPDSWSWDAASGINQASAWIGKCCPVQSGRWISDWVLRSLNGEPGRALDRMADDKSVPDEFIYNNTLDYKRWDREVSRLAADKR